MDEKRTKALITFPLKEEKIKAIEQLGYKVQSRREKDLAMDKEIENTEVMICFDPFNKIDVSALTQLKWIQLISKGINHVPTDQPFFSNIKITNNTESTSVPIGEWIVASILQIFKRSPAFYENKRKRKWKMEKDILEIYGKTIGFLGTGNIAVQAAKRLKAFDAMIYGINRTHRQQTYFDHCFSEDEADEFYAACDVIVCTLPDTKATYHYLNHETFNKMKTGVTLVNVSRGSIIDEKALIEKIEEDFFRGVALDVFEEEPLNENSKLWELDSVIITPHNAFYSDLHRERIFEMIYGNMKRYKNGQPLKNIVDFEKGY